MRDRVSSRRRALAGAVSLLIAGSVAAAAYGSPRYRPLARGGIDGSGEATMQMVSVPARVARVAVVPGSADEYWAIGLSHASLPGWNPNRSPGGQVVFLRNRKESGWVVAGPPKSGGSIINPVLTSFDLASNGEGWAVGESGLILHKPAGSDEWAVHHSSGSTSQILNDVSVVTAGGSVAGFAAGAGGTVLSLRDGVWSADNTTAIVTPDEGVPELVSISATSQDEAWTVTGSGSRSLYVFKRQGGGWTRADVGDQVFDGPHPRPTTRGFTISSATGASVEADGQGGAWVGGSLVPSDPAHPFGDDNTTGDAARPFVIRFQGSETVSYCPDIYWVRVEGSGADTTTLCQKPFPLSAFDVTDIQIAGDAVFAGGLGLYRYDPASDGWFREPNGNGYLVSVAMSSPSNGWVASSGNTFGAGGAVHSSTPTLGHWTSAPSRARAKRWPATVTQVLESVAVAPSGTEALAVGSKGATARFQAGGWDRITPTTALALHSVAWPEASSAWAVGEQGLVMRYDGSRWNIHPNAHSVTTRSLFGLAFRGASEGYAVGAGGTVLKFNKDGWEIDPSARGLTGENLYAIASTANGFVAVGAKGTVLERGAGGWKLRTDVKQLVERPGRPPADLWAVTPVSGGGVIVGGSFSSLLNGRVGGGFTTYPQPIEGTVIALGVVQGRIVASVSPDPEKYKGDRIRTGRGSLLVREADGWRDIQFARSRSLYLSTDPSKISEAVFGVASEPTGRGWAVGGYPENTPDEEGHLAVSALGSVFRVDLTGDPSAPGASTTPKLTGPISFAFFSDSACGRGLCSAAAGSGTMGDSVALQIREEINRMSKLSGGPKFVLFGGNGRLEGVPEEVRQFGNFLKTFDVPVYGAIGSKDLFEGLDSESFGYPDFIAPLTSSYLGSNNYWMENLSDAPGPWGEGPSPSYIKPVQGPATEGGLARTYYAFDFAPGGRSLFRVIVLNSSTRSYGRGDGADQNPRYPQGSWFSEVLAGAAVNGLPTVIAMNQPTIIPSSTQLDNWPGAPSDKATFESSVVAARASAVLTGGLRVNSVGFLPRPEAAVVPVYIMGGGGAPMGGLGAGLFPDSKLPSDGFYPAWHLVTVDPSKVTDGQMEVKVETFPVLEHISLNALDGRRAQAGQPLRFKALMRASLGGFSDPEQSKTIYQELGWDAPEPCSGTGQGFGSCRSLNALSPAHHFYSEDPSIADFVLASQPYSLLQPLKTAGGALVKDPTGQLGFLCTFKPGSTYINVVSGFHRSRLPLTVGAGFGPCINQRISDPVIQPPDAPDPPVVEEPVQQPFARFSDIPQPLALIFPPPPAPVVAPAPPASVGMARKEEVEEAEETQGSDAVRMQHEGRYDVQLDPKLAFMVLGLVALGAAMGASVIRQSRSTPDYAYLRVSAEKERP